MKERRSTPRVKENFPVKIFCGSKTYRGTSHDVSLGGLCCSSPVALPVSAIVRVNLALPASGDYSAGEGVICRAKVVRSESPGPSGEPGYRLAFNFDKMPEESRKELEAFIRRRVASVAVKGKKIMTENAAISPQGISCKSDIFIPLFSEVQINVTMPARDLAGVKKNNIECSGVVVNCEKEKTGDCFSIDLYFVDIDRSDRQLISKYLEVASALSS